MDVPDSPAGAGGGTPRKSLWRSASWSARSSPTSVPAAAASTSTSTSSRAVTKPRPSPLHLPPPSVSRCLRAWPLPAPSDSSPSSSPAASSLVDGDLSCVTDHIYLGGDAAARDRDLLRRHGITHVLNCAGFSCPERFSGEIRYRTLWLRDHPGEDITSLLYGVFDFLEEASGATRGRGRALLHCSRGTSRSAALVVAYLMWRRAIPFDEALRLVRAARPAADPNPGFASQLLHWQRRVVPSLPLPSPQNTSPRVYRLAPHSPYDPLHLVPKTVDRSGPAKLDSRGAFLVHAPAVERGAVYLWVGTECEPAMVASAGDTARQVLRYERARGPIINIGEGSEPAEFWDALGYSAAYGGGELSTVGRKRVQSYDLDFEIYRRALKGGPATAAALTSLPEVGGTTPMTTVDPNNGDDIDTSGPFGSPSSLSGGWVTPTSSDSSTLLTFSPVSSSSDWYNSSPGSDLSFGEQQSLYFSRPPLPPSVPSLAERRGGTGPPLLLQTHKGESENAGDAVKDWPFSPYPLGREEDDGSMEIDQVTPSDLGQTIEVEGVTLYHWQPCLQKIEMLHPGVLDSKSVFILLASKRSTGNGETKTLFVWVGRDYHMTHVVDGHGEGMEDEDVQAYFQRIGLEFLNQMTLPVDIPVQVKQMEDEIFISQSKYTLEIIKKYNMDHCKPISTPMATTDKIAVDEIRRVVDSILYRGYQRR